MYVIFLSIYKHQVLKLTFIKKSIYIYYTKCLQISFKNEWLWVMAVWFYIIKNRKGIIVIAILKLWAMKGKTPYKESRITTLNCIDMILKYFYDTQQHTLFSKSSLDSQSNTDHKGQRASEKLSVSVLKFCESFGVFLHNEGTQGVFQERCWEFSSRRVHDLSWQEGSVIGKDKMSITFTPKP